MDTPRKKDQKFPKNKIYRKNIKARGQKLQISKKFNKKKESATKNKNYQNKNKNYSTKEYSLTNIEKNNILEEIKNTKNKIEQYENYLKKSLNQKLSNEIQSNTIIGSSKKNNKISSVVKNTDYNLDINDVLNSLNERYNSYSDYNNIIKKAPNISLISNSLILNYMDKVNNNISVKSTITSKEKSIKDTKNDMIFSPYNKNMNKMIFNNRLNYKKNETITNVNKRIIHINKPKFSKISKSCNKYYDSSFKKKNNNVLKNMKSISIKKIENNNKIEEIKNKKHINLNIKRFNKNRRNNTANIEKLIDNFMEKKFEKENKEVNKDIINKIQNKIGNNII